MKKHNPARKTRAVGAHGLAALFVLATAGCGGGGDDTPAPTPAPAPAQAMPTIAAAVDLDDNHQIGVTSTQWSDGNTATGGNGQAVQGVQCAPSLSQTFHVHSHLSIFVNGQAQAIAANVGIVDTPTTDCHYYIHTHDRSGKIHLEAPTQMTLTLGQFFAIWGQPLTTTNVAGVQNLPVSIYITENDTVTQFTGDPATIPLLSHRHIAIVLGTPIVQVPLFTWTAN